MMSNDYEADSVHLWIGTNHDSESDYFKYFELDYSTEGDFEDPSYKVCAFCQYLGINWYDEDFIGIIPREDKDIPLDELLQEAAVDQSEINNVKKICLNLGINKANSILWYSSSDIDYLPAIGSDFKGLKYIGCFKGD
jgi:hypothetical protein